MRRIYPPDGRITLDGGLNNKFERSIILDNESPDCLNVMFSNGSVGTRGGSSKLNTAAIGSFVGDGLYTRRTNTGAETMVAFAGGSMWQLGGTTFTVVASATSVFTAGVRVATAQYENHMFIGNGGVTPYKYNGTNFTRHGVPAATGVVTTVSQAVGVLTGDYQYKITYVNSQAAEGDVGTATATLAVITGQIRLTNIPVAPVSHGVSSRRIYRTTTSGVVFKRVTELNDNTTTQYDDNLADAGLGATAPTDNGEPPKYSQIIYHQNRLFVNDPLNPNFIWYSEIGEPYTFKATSFRRVGDATSDIVIGFGIYDNSVVVYCEKSQFLIYMEDADPNNWREIKIKSSYGSMSPFGMFDFDNKQMFPAMQNDKFVGFAALQGDSVSPDATLLTVSAAGSDLQSQRIEPDVFNVVESFVGNVSSIVYKNKAWITLTYGTGQTTNNRIYHFDFSYSNLSKEQKYSWVPFTGLNAAQLTIYNGNLYYISSTATGFVYQADTTNYNDDGSAINSYIWTKEFVGYKQEVNNHKDFRDAYMLVDKAGDYFMNVTYRTDSDLGAGNTNQIDLDPGGSLWGTMVWGSSVWGGGQAQQKIRLTLANANGERIQFRFSNQNAVNQRFKVHWMNFSYNPKGVR